MQVEVRVLGKSPAWQDDGGACSGYLVRADGFTLLLDCGNGVFAKLRAVLDYVEVDAIVISHLHADHILDLVPYSLALAYSPRLHPNGSGRPALLAAPPHPPLYAPPGARGRFRELSSALGQPDQIESAFDVREYDPAQSLAVGPFAVRFCEVPHYTRCFAIELAAPDRRFTFGADCAPSDALTAFAAGTDLLMLEATLEHPETSGMRGHMTAAEAGEIGRRAGARRLVVTHYSDELDAGWVAAEAARGFGGEVTLASEGVELSV
jgi:ribonuclease BN (tRNA processing enzyme)